MCRVVQAVFAALLMCAAVGFSADRAEAETVLASWYGPGFAGQPTASGEPYNPNGFTAAHKTLPLGTQLEVGYDGRSVLVTINDRGPYVGSRALDLSRAAADHLGLTREGVDYVTYNYAGDVAYGGPAGADSVAAAGPRADYSQTNYSDASTSVGTGAGGGYTVRSGDTLHEIANRLGADVDTLAAANGIRNPNVVRAGRTIYHGRYTVQPGDSLHEVADMLGTSVDDLAAANGIRNPNVVRAGRTIHY